MYDTAVSAHESIILPVGSVNVKLGLSHGGKNIGWGAEENVST